MDYCDTFLGFSGNYNFLKKTKKKKPFNTLKIKEITCLLMLFFGGEHLR